MKKEQEATMKKAAATAKKAVGLTSLTAKQGKKRLSKIQKSTIAMRSELWKEVTEEQLWLRLDKTGFTTIPRTMSLFMAIIDAASKQVTAGAKSAPAGKTYLVLWCRVFDEGMVRIESEATAAKEAGYGGERNVTTWRQHLAVLKDLGFIDFKPGPAGPNQYVLLYNPYHAVKALKEKGWVQEDMYIALFQRALEIGAEEDLRDDGADVDTDDDE
ncbi:hypothetical protein [Burkholderia gladioli]|uniref:hypothetical protein n=1 Tax=Burkholderia gladioli TaxID=28095 RepID=UPI00163F99B9|nr:hypothetical protein [Burkholderia gladioli]